MGKRAWQAQGMAGIPSLSLGEKQSRNEGNGRGGREDVSNQLRDSKSEDFAR